MIRVAHPHPGRRAKLAGLLIVGLAGFLITCQVDQLLSPPATAALLTSLGVVADSAPVGSTAMLGHTISVSSSGTSVTWSARAVDTASWLVLSALSGTTPSTFTVQFNPGHLPTGTYTDSIAFTPALAAGSATYVPVSFKVKSCSITPEMIDARIADSLTTGDCAAPHGNGQFGEVYSFSDSGNDSLSAVLVSGFGAIISLDTSLAPAALVVARAPNCSLPQQTTCFLYRLLPQARTYYVEVMSASAGQTGSYTLALTRPHPPSAPDSLGQYLSDSATTVPIGGAVAHDTLVFRAVLNDPDLGDSLVLQVEAKPTGTGFTGVPTATSVRVGNGAHAWVTVSGLSNNAFYHWQARTLDQTGRGSPWLAFGSPA
ncbi:MAG TPA: hypothetical protein VN848_13070, partial [Gemmatimonadales bacterium]|nr:hypothetical protein [Gemmatimonadales bacterium]